MNPDAYDRILVAAGRHGIAPNPNPPNTMPKFIIEEVARYEVDADNEEAALEKFLMVDDIRQFPCTVADREVLPDPQPQP